jgi:hypothetical protein
MECDTGTKLPDPTFLTPDQQIQNILGATGQGTLGLTALLDHKDFLLTLLECTVTQ